MEAFNSDMYAAGVAFLYPVVPNTFSSAFKMTTKGK